MEVYNGKLTDLVSGRPCRLRDTGAANGDRQFVLRGCESTQVAALGDVLRVLRIGETRKRFAATAMNGRSSRAHTVFVVSLTQSNARTGTVVQSRLHLVDLAGSERLKKSRVTGQRKKEAIGINGSLMVLGKCINALVEGKRHVPYYESTLTMLLKGAFGGNSRTTAIVCASMDDAHGHETLQSLRFGERCSMITNSVRFAATSKRAALAAIDGSLRACEEQMRGLEAKRRTALPVYTTLCDRYRQLKQRRVELSQQQQREEEEELGDLKGGTQQK